MSGVPDDLIEGEDVEHVVPGGGNILACIGKKKIYLHRERGTARDYKQDHQFAFRDREKVYNHIRKYHNECSHTVDQEHVYGPVQKLFNEHKNELCKPADPYYAGTVGLEYCEEISHFKWWVKALCGICGTIRSVGRSMTRHFDGSHKNTKDRKFTYV